MGLGLVGRSLVGSANFMNNNLLKILPFSALFFCVALAYSLCWYVLDTYKDVACLNGNYIIEMMFCSLFLGVLGKEGIAVLISSFSIIPFAGLVYLVHKIVNNDDRGILHSIRGSLNGIVKIAIFRFCLTLLIFSPFILYMIFGGDIIKQYVTDTGRLTLSKLLTVGLLPIPITLLIGFTLGALLEPVFQYVEYEVLILGARVRDAARSSYTIAMKYKIESFVFGFLFVGIWYALIFAKFLYMVNPILVAALLAAIFIESFFLFPLRAVALYFMWKELRSGYEIDERRAQTKIIKGYMDKMLLG